MKNSTRLFKKCLFAAALLVSSWASAATYTAVSSGAWSSSSTWAGGDAPGGSVGTLDNVIINSGVTVTLDMDVEFSGLLTGLQVDGTLMSSTGDYMLNMESGALSGTGTLTLHNLRFGAGASMSFTGDASVDNLWNESLALNIAADMDINDTLFLDAGTFNLAAGGDLTFTSGAAIRIDDGSMTVTSGVLNNSNDYSVHYVGQDKDTGMELAGDGLTNVWVQLDDNNQALSITGNVTIHGVLHHNEGMIDLNGGTLTLMNDYMSMSGAEFAGSATSSLHIEHTSALSSPLMFDEDNDELNDLTVMNDDADGGVELGSDLTINGTLWLEDGDFTVTSGTLTMATGSEIILDGGHLENNGGSFDGTSSYSVTYSGDASTWSGIELTGSGLNDLTIDLGNEADSVEFMNDVNVDGELSLERGGAALNGNDLVLDGSLSTSSMGWLSGDMDSDIEFNTSSLNNDTLWFHADNHTFGTFTINADDNSDLMIGNDLRVENINMSTGGIHMWDSELRIESTGTITGADADRYVMIDGDGSLAMNVQVSAPYAWFPVGTEDGYAPVGLQQNSGTAGYFMVSTYDGVWADGSNEMGTNMALTGAMVDRTWNIESESGAAMDMNVMMQWEEDSEVNGFDRDDAYIMNYSNGGWDADMQTSMAATQVGDMWQIERDNVTSDGPFAVRDGSTTGLDENVIAAEIYPNPVQNILHTVASFDEATTVELVDPAGNVLRTESVTGAVNQEIDFSAYPSGVYFLNYRNSKGARTYRVVKTL